MDAKINSRWIGALAGLLLLPGAAGADDTAPPLVTGARVCVDVRGRGDGKKESSRVVGTLVTIGERSLVLRLPEREAMLEVPRDDGRRLEVSLGRRSPATAPE